MITKQTILTLNPKHPYPEKMAAHLNEAALKAGITTRLRLAHWLAQLAHESALIPVEESLYYSRPERLMQVWPSRFPSLAMALPWVRNPVGLGNKVYGGRLGNALGEGYLYRGRGLIQLTGKNNYARYGRLAGVDLVKNPSLLCDPRVSALVAGLFWQANGCNELADKNDVLAITKRINGGITGLSHRRQNLLIASRHLGV